MTAGSDNWVFGISGSETVRHERPSSFLITSRLARQGIRLRSDQGRADALPRTGSRRHSLKTAGLMRVMLSWDEVAAMKASGLVEFHSHTHTHQRWDKLMPDRSRRNEALRTTFGLQRKSLKEEDWEAAASGWPQGFYETIYLPR